MFFYFRDLLTLLKYRTPNYAVNINYHNKLQKTQLSNIKELDITDTCSAQLPIETYFDKIDAKLKEKYDEKYYIPMMRYKE